jgi:RND family efflux transporter MFP subunit
LAAARIAGADARVVAPYDGVVIARLAEAGDLATPGRPLVSMARTGALRVDLTVPETHAGVVGVGDKVTVAIDAIGGQRLQARISAVAPASNPASRSFLAKAELNGVDHLQPGMFARVFIPLGRNEVLLIPTSAVVNQGQLAGVFVVDQDNTARLRVIRTGQRFGDRVEVLSGLAEGERFVSTVSPALVDGARVEVGS